MLTRKLANRIRRKVRFGFVRRPSTAHLYVSLSGWPLRPRLGRRPDVPSESSVGPRGDGPSIKLNIGGGKGHPKVDGWTVVDLREQTADITLDITTEALPYGNDSVDVIFSSHTLEHIYPQRLDFVLKEFYRVLKPGTGLLRIGVPDIEVAITAYAHDDYAFFEHSDVGQFDSQAPIGGLLASWFYSTRIFANGALRHGEGHVHCFDYDYLAYWLRQAGFPKVWRSSWHNSTLPELRGAAFDRHPNDTLFVESTK